MCSSCTHGLYKDKSNAYHICTDEYKKGRMTLDMHRGQSVAIGYMKSTYRPVTSSVLQVSILCPNLFNICIKDLQSVEEFIISKFADDTNLGEMADTPQDSAANWRDLDSGEMG